MKTSTARALTAGLGLAALAAFSGSAAAQSFGSLDLGSIPGVTTSTPTSGAPAPSLGSLDLGSLNDTTAPTTTGVPADTGSLGSLNSLRDDSTPTSGAPSLGSLDLGSLNDTTVPTTPGAPTPVNIGSLPGLDTGSLPGLGDAGSVTPGSLAAVGSLAAGGLLANAVINGQIALPPLPPLPQVSIPGLPQIPGMPGSVEQAHEHPHEVPVAPGPQDPNGRG